MVKRRALIQYTALSTAIALVTGVWGRDRATAQTASGTKIGSLATLKQKGQLTGKTPKGPVTIVPQGKSNQWSAVNPTCSHEGCEVRWQAKGGKFVCPCHGAEFNAQGKPLKGPAKKNLATYQVKISGDTVSVL